jgi:hypothetical protein
VSREPLHAYVASLPERLLRSISALAGGAAHELGEAILPARVRRSRLYYALVDSVTRFLVEQVGQVEGAYPPEGVLPDDYLIRNAAGSVIGIAGLAAFHASPLWVFAALSDLAGAGREMIAEVARSLQQEGLLEPDTRFETMDQLLDGLERTSARLTDAVNTPPLDVPQLRSEWHKLRAEAAGIPRALLPPARRIRAQWDDVKKEAAAQGRSALEVSSVMALNAVRTLPANARWLSNVLRSGGQRAGELLARGLLDHYRETLGEIHRTGYVRYWMRELRPYVEGAARQFSRDRVSWTERLLARRRTPKEPK